MASSSSARSSAAADAAARSDAETSPLMSVLPGGSDEDGEVKYYVAWCPCRDARPPAGAPKDKCKAKLKTHASEAGAVNNIFRHLVDSPYHLLDEDDARFRADKAMEDGWIEVKTWKRDAEQPGKNIIKTIKPASQVVTKPSKADLRDEILCLQEELSIANSRAEHLANRQQFAYQVRPDKVFRLTGAELQAIRDAMAAAAASCRQIEAQALAWQTTAGIQGENFEKGVQYINGLFEAHLHEMEPTPPAGPPPKRPRR